MALWPDHFRKKMLTQASIKQSHRRSFLTKKTPSSSILFRSLQLQAPTILPQPQSLYSDNHLLVVNKPPGWQVHGKGNGSGSGDETKKCLLTYLQTNKLGGGSKNDFLLPLHRIDQPCSGKQAMVKWKSVFPMMFADDFRYSIYVQFY